MTIFIIITILVVSFILAWRALGEIERKVDSVRRWSTIVFLKGRQIFYKASEEEKKT